MQENEILSSSFDNSLRLFDLEKKDQKDMWYSPHSPIISMAALKQTICSGHEDGYIKYNYLTCSKYKCLGYGICENPRKLLKKFWSLMQFGFLIWNFCLQMSSYWPQYKIFLDFLNLVFLELIWFHGQNMGFEIKLSPFYPQRSHR